MAKSDLNMPILSLAVASILVACTHAHNGFIGFGYTGNGPSKWGNLSSEYKSCSIGNRQSPVNIMQDDAAPNAKLHDLDRLYVDANATLINTGFNVALQFEKDGGFMTQDGKNYKLKRLIWHTPSEHTIDKQQFPVELQLVHESDDGKLVVVAVLYDFGNPDSFIYQLKDALAQLAKERCSVDDEAQVQVGRVRTKALKRHTRRFFKYVGSLTTPPCTENVTWYILGKVRKVARDQITLLKSPLNQEFQNNARPVQPPNGRVVELYDEAKHSARRSN
ncbi:hypothetical protein HPP92_009045 [Vanilla planifolia]|uniref:Alpha-carbonic anhydrase domain-containing protein n=1 Tax=Vanilla planifolia TaxID=51239 RepID=A0A835R992_VANPL|nr:hypothetical protein HPP92_009045 [Vanilla planifolia]